MTLCPVILLHTLRRFSMYLPLFHHLLLLETEYGLLQRRAAWRQRTARAEGTQKNHRSTVRVFLAFCRRLRIQPYSTSYEDICAYLEYISDYVSAPSSLRNKLSHIRVHMTLVEAPTSSLSHPRVLRAIDSFERNKDYIPRVKDPIPPAVFRSILLHLPDDYISNILRASMLCLYYGAMRQSELLPPSTKTWDSAKHPLRRDIQIKDNMCFIFVKFGKNLQRVGQYRRIVLAAADDSRLCPVDAMSKVLTDAPSKQDDDPVFMFQHTCAPVPASFVAKRFHQILHELGHGLLSPSLSLHSLRKAAATNAFDGGCPELSIKNYGCWSSDAYTTYISTQNTRVNQALISSIQLPK